MKLTNVKVLTVTTEVANNRFSEVLEVIGENQVLEVVEHGEFVTYIYMKQLHVYENNLNRMTAKEVESLCKENGIKIYGKPCQVTKKKSKKELIEEKEKALKSAKNNEERDVISTNYYKAIIRLNDTKEKEIRGISLFKKTEKKGKFTKSNLIGKLLETCPRYNDFNFYLI